MKRTTTTTNAEGTTAAAGGGAAAVTTTSTNTSNATPLRPILRGRSSSLSSTTGPDNNTGSPVDSAAVRRRMNPSGVDETLPTGPSRSGSNTSRLLSGGGSGGGSGRGNNPTTTKQYYHKIKFRNPLKPEEPPLISDRALFYSLWIIFITYTVIILFGDLFLLPYVTNWCPYSGMLKAYPNPDSAPSDVCYYYRTPWLFGLNTFECDFGRRVIASLIFGSCIGYERKAADRPAGIRTMSLVCLGACLFTMCGQFAFRATTQEWDSARVSAAVPSGVGFLGSALIWKETKESNSGSGTPYEKNSVHGLTTAASVWLSAAVGIGAGGALYIYCAWCVVLVLFVLRLGPRMVFIDTDEGSFNDTGSEWETGDEANRGGTTTDDGGDGLGDDGDDDDEEEIKPLSRHEQWIKLQQEAPRQPPQPLPTAAAAAAADSSATDEALGQQDEQQKQQQNQPPPTSLTKEDIAWINSIAPARKPLHAARSAPQLFLVSTTGDGADDLLASFQQTELGSSAHRHSSRHDLQHSSRHSRLRRRGTHSRSSNNISFLS